MGGTDECPIHNDRCSRMVIFTIAVLLMISLMAPGACARRGRGRGRGRLSKIFIAFANAKEFNMIQPANEQDYRSPQVIRASHFMQGYRLGGKILLICAVEGEPRPIIRWFKEYSELMLKDNTYIYEKRLGENQTWSKIEIDPATVGDGGIFTCVGQNVHGNTQRNYKVELYS